MRAGHVVTFNRSGVEWMFCAAADRPEPTYGGRAARLVLGVHIGPLSGEELLTVNEARALAQALNAAADDAMQMLQVAA